MKQKLKEEERKRLQKLDTVTRHNQKLGYERQRNFPAKVLCTECASVGRLTEMIHPGYIYLTDTVEKSNQAAPVECPFCGYMDHKYVIDKKESQPRLPTLDETLTGHLRKLHGIVVHKHPQIEDPNTLLGDIIYVNEECTHWPYTERRKFMLIKYIRLTAMKDYLFLAERMDRTLRR